MGNPDDGVACVRDFLLSTLFCTLAPPLRYASSYTTCGVMDSGNHTLHMMLLSSICALSYTKFNQTWLLIHHDGA